MRSFLLLRSNAPCLLLLRRQRLPRIGHSWCTTTHGGVQRRRLVSSSSSSSSSSDTAAERTRLRKHNTDPQTIKADLAYCVNLVRERDGEGYRTLLYRTYSTVTLYFAAALLTTIIWLPLVFSHTHTHSPYYILYYTCSVWIANAGGESRLVFCTESVQR
jgi:hypothetical protein